MFGVLEITTVYSRMIKEIVFPVILFLVIENVHSSLT